MLLAIEDICGKHVILKRKNLLKELHTAIKELYQQGVFSHLHSCLEELLNTALVRFEELGLCEVSRYGNKQGNATEFVLSHNEMRAKIDETVAILTDLRGEQSAKEIRILDGEIESAVERAQGPVFIAKL